MTRSGSRKYGGRGRPWNPKFIKYMEFIARHPAYRGMPDASYEPGRIQWEAPSNRSGGRFKDTHAKRRKWWAREAAKLGISTSSKEWISRVAKRIHPTKRKPCKICGRELELRYVYPQGRFLKKVRELPFVRKSFDLPILEPITSLVRRLVGEYGERALAALPELFVTPQVSLPSPLPPNLAGWMNWLDDIYIPAEPKGIMSPGAMSNAPDRFDGFHSDNLCCRSTADKGRTKRNLQSYVTDRRVFEYWASGDWVSADRLMGQLRAGFSKEGCRCGNPGPCAVDHIGPISLGFTHRPRFQLLCGSCNGAKNNRMYLSDVTLLLADERAGDEVVSWHSTALWDACKSRVCSNEHARRLSKMLRDNRHSLMDALQKIADAGAYTFLATLLDLDRANFDIEFEVLRIKDHLAVFDRVVRKRRTTKYADEQKARRCRIAFTELLSYFAKPNRNSFVVQTTESQAVLQEAIAILEADSAATRSLDVALRSAATSASGGADSAFRALLPRLADTSRPAFKKARELLRRHMDLIGAELARRWGDERYVREVGDDETVRGEN